MTHATTALRTLLLGFGVLAALGSASTATYAPTPHPRFPAKPANCELEVLSLPPQRQFQELGTFDLEGLESTRTSTKDVLEIVQADACRDGADAVFAQSNGQGVYVKATAVRYVENDEPESEEDPPTASEP